MRNLIVFMGLAALTALPAGITKAEDPAKPAEAIVKAETEPSEAAMTFVGGFSDLHLQGMLQRIGARQPTLVAASTLDGGLLAAIFEAEVAKAVKVHGPAWQRNMALAWTPLLSDAEMSSLATSGAQSPHLDKYLGLRSKAGQAMQASSGDLFKSILAEVVQSTLQQMGETGGADAERKQPRKE